MQLRGKQGKKTTKPARFNTKDDEIVYLERRLDSKIANVQSDVDRLSLKIQNEGPHIDKSARYLLMMLGLTVLNIALAFSMVFDVWSS